MILVGIRCGIKLPLNFGMSVYNTLTKGMAYVEIYLCECVQRSKKKYVRKNNLLDHDGHTSTESRHQTDPDPMFLPNGCIHGAGSDDNCV